MSVEAIEKIKSYPIVDRNLLMKHFGYSKEYAYLVLQRLKKRAILKKIIKGKYTPIDDIYKIATNIYFPSYISLLTASMLKRATEQIIRTVQVVCNYNKEVRILNYEIEFIKAKQVFGYENKDGIFIADNEKLLIDMLLYRRHSGNFSETIKIIKGLEFNIPRLISYLKRICNLSLIKRAGFLLENYRQIDISGNFGIDNNYVRLDVFGHSNKINSKWRMRYD